MFNRLKNRIKFLVERLLLRGAHYRILVIASLVGIIAVLGGILVQASNASFERTDTAIWWAFLRLTDPGYLGDDEGLARRIISTVITILGYVTFMGALIAIMTQWLNQTIRKLEQGFTPIVQNNHILILGWTNRTPAIVEELMRSEGRVRRFLRRRRARGLHVVILTEDVSLERTQELREELGPLWDAHKITFRSGTPLRVEHLERVDFQNASAIILPGADFAYGSADASDTRIIKTLLSVAHHNGGTRPNHLPLLVTEIFDPSKIPMVKETYHGTIEVLASDVFISRCIAQTVRHPGLSRIFREILSHGDGNEVYVRTPEQFTGFKFGELFGAYPRAVLLGVVRPVGGDFETFLNPAADLVLESEDRLVFLARRYEDCHPPKTYRAQQSLVRAPEGVVDPPVQTHRRILILGWNHKASDLLAEFDRYTHETFDISILSLTPIADRQMDLDRKGMILQRVSVAHYEGDYTAIADVKTMTPHAFDNVVLLGSDRLETEEESDARTIVGHMMLTGVLADCKEMPEVLVELMDLENLLLFDARPGEVLVTPMMISHVLAQVALRRELHVVYEELFGPGGAEIFFRPVADYGLMDETVPFRTLKEMATCRGEIALGVRLHNQSGSTQGWVQLNPDLDETWTLCETDELVVLTTYGVADAENTDLHAEG